MMRLSSEEWNVEHLARYIRRPLAEDNKYTRGVLGFITGSVIYPGAAVLGVEAAFRTGIGLVRFSGEEKVADLVINRRPETVLAPGAADAWVLGSGQDQTPNKPNSYIEPNSSVVLDGSAIASSDYFEGLKVLTPHVGELARLFLDHKSPHTSLLTTNMNQHELQQEIRNDPLFWGSTAAKEHDAVVVLKGATTYVISQDHTFDFRCITISKLPHQLSTAGTGDVLAGVIGALLASNIAQFGIKNIRPVEVVASAVLLHKLAALVALNDSRVLTALDLAVAISRNETYSYQALD